MTGEELITPDTTCTSPWMDTNKSPGDFFVNTVTQGTLSAVNANQNLVSTSISVLTEAMSPADKVDSWFASDSAGPSQSSTSRPITTDTGLPSLAGDQSQLSNQNVEDIDSDPFIAGLGTRNLFMDSFPDDPSQQSNTEVDVSTRIPSSTLAKQTKLSTSNLRFRDPFFDSVPKGPSQLSTSRWNARAPFFDSWSSTRGQAHIPSWNKAESLSGEGEHP